MINNKIIEIGKNLSSDYSIACQNAIKLAEEIRLKYPNSIKKQTDYFMRKWFVIKYYMSDNPLRILKPKYWKSYKRSYMSYIDFKYIVIFIAIAYLNGHNINDEIVKSKVFCCLYEETIDDVALRNNIKNDLDSKIEKIYITICREYYERNNVGKRIEDAFKERIPSINHYKRKFEFSTKVFRQEKA